MNHDTTTIMALAKPLVEYSKGGSSKSKHNRRILPKAGERELEIKIVRLDAKYLWKI